MEFDILTHLFLSYTLYVSYNDRFHRGKGLFEVSAAAMAFNRALDENS